MKKIFEARISYTECRDFDVETEARSWVEANGSGRVVTFIKDFDGRARSCAMDVFDEGAWNGVDITR